MQISKLLLFLYVLFFVFLPYASAEELRIGTIERPPFVMESSDGELSGFSVDLWSAVAERLDLEYNIEIYDIFSELLKDTESARNDLSIGNISITSQREKIMDFSNPIFDSWLALMIKSDSIKQVSFIDHLLHWQTLAIIFFLILWPVIGYNVISKKKLKKRWHLYALLYIFACTSLVSYSYTNFIISDRLSQIYNIGTLWNKDVASISSSTAEKFLIEFGIPNTSYSTIEEIYESIASGKHEVLVHDYPVLLYKSEQDPTFTLVGETFKKEKYGILYPKWSILKEDINVALLELQSEWVYDDIYTTYFWDE